MDQKIARISQYLSTLSAATDFKPMAIAPVLANIFVLDIERTPAGPKLRVKLIGTALESVFGRSLTGQHLENFIHGPRGADVIRGFHDCVETRKPLWMRQIVKIKNEMPRFVEGVLFYLEPERIYGGLAVGEWTHDHLSTFERRAVTNGAAIASP